jgi:hypothetical protein
MRITALLALASVITFGACSSSRDQAEPTWPPAAGLMPSVVGAPYDRAVTYLSLSGLCVDKVIVVDPDKLREGPLPTVGVVYAQQPGPGHIAEVSTTELTLEMIGGAPERQAALSHRSVYCQAPVVIRGPSVGRDKGPWYVGTPEEASAARSPTTST